MSIGKPGDTFRDKTLTGVNRQLGSPSHTLTLEGNNFSPIEINAYPVADTHIQYVLVSNRNPEAFFNGKKSGLFSRVMVGQDAFLPDPAE